jgi:hypothetical protein
MMLEQKGFVLTWSPLFQDFSLESSSHFWTPFFHGQVDHLFDYPGGPYLICRRINLFGSQCVPVNTVGAGLFARCLICMPCHGLFSLAFSVQFSVPYDFPR